VKYRRYRGHKSGYIFRKVCRGLGSVGFLVILGAVGNHNAGATLVPCMIGAVIGLVMFAGFGYLGGLFNDPAG